MTVGRLPSIDGGIQPTIVDAKGDLITAVAADTPARLAVGANGTVLTADSSTATGLKWATASAGGMTLIGSGAFSGDTTISSISSSYNDLQLVLSDCATSDSSDIDLRINGVTTSSYTTQTIAGATGAAAAAQWTGPLNWQTSSNGGSIIVTLFNYTSTTANKIGTRFDYQRASATPTFDTFGRVLNSSITNAISSLTFFSSSGGTISGNYKLYGVK